MKVFKSIVLGISTIICIVFLVLFFTQMFKINKSDISVTEEITISSDVNNVIQQNYFSTIRGTIKNNTDKAIENLKIHLSVKTTTLNHKGTITINIDKIEAGEELAINEVRATTENFEKVKEIRYQIADGERKYIANGDGVVINGWAFLYLIPTLLFGFLSIKVAISFKHDKRHIVAVSQPATQSTRDNALAHIIAQQQENERRRIELEKQRINMDLTRVEFEKQKEAATRPRYCSYCGTKNDANASKCINCGSIMQ